MSNDIDDGGDPLSDFLARHLSADSPRRCGCHGTGRDRGGRADRNCLGPGRGRSRRSLDRSAGAATGERVALRSRRRSAAGNRLPVSAVLRSGRLLQHQPGPGRPHPDEERRQVKGDGGAAPGRRLS